MNKTMQAKAFKWLDNNIEPKTIEHLSRPIARLSMAFDDLEFEDASKLLRTWLKKRGWTTFRNA